MSKIPLIVVCGPTASGKTALSIEIAKEYRTEVISADSMQVYRQMSIGTAKPDEEERQGIVHHMIDILNVDQPFNVSDFCEMAHREIYSVYEKGMIPVLVGGTGLYIDSFVNDIDFSESSTDALLRENIEKFAHENGAAAVHAMLADLDADAAAAIHPNNVKRVIRAIEHIKLTGEKFSNYKTNAALRESRYNAIYLMPDRNREELYGRINRRVDEMIKRGLIDEAKSIYDMSLPAGLTALSSIGYKELFEYFSGNITLDEAIEKIKLNSRHYAKRQLTWFNKNKSIHKLDCGSDMVREALSLIDNWLADNNFLFPQA